MGKFVTKREMSKRHISAILGQIRANLLALPFLRAFTTELVQFLAKTSTDPWDKKFLISVEIKLELQNVRNIMEKWTGRPFPKKATRILHSDSSDFAWGGVDSTTGEKVQEYWREKRFLYINQKEMMASISTVRSLAKPHETVELNVDNQVIYYYLSKGGGTEKPLQLPPSTVLPVVDGKKNTLHLRWVPS